MTIKRGPLALLATTIAVGASLAAWKHSAISEAAAAAASQVEPAESVQAAVALEREHTRTTTSIGTVIAARSITVRNELAGAVRQAALEPGAIVEPGAVLVALDVSVERAQLQALEAQARLARTQHERMVRMSKEGAASAMELDAAKAEYDIAQAQIAQLEAVIERKTIRAPFRARVGISDVHPGQYLNEGALLTTLQGVDDFAYVDFTVPQQVAATLRPGQEVELYTAGDATPIKAELVAVDARVDPSTRNAVVRAQLPVNDRTPAPGASVRVQTPVGAPLSVIAVPASALRKGPEGDHVFVLAQDEHGDTRVRSRPVQVAALTGDEVVIQHGLEAGEQVVASGSFKLREAALVAVIEQPEAVALASAPTQPTQM